MPQITGLTLWYPSMAFDHEINLNGLRLVLSGRRVRYISLLDCFLQDCYFLSSKQKFLKGDFWKVSFLLLCFQSLWIIPEFFFISRVGNEIRLNKSPEFSKYGKFNCNYRWDTAKTGIVRAKFQFSVWI